MNSIRKLKYVCICVVGFFLCAGSGCVPPDVGATVEICYIQPDLTICSTITKPPQEPTTKATSFEAEMEFPPCGSGNTNYGDDSGDDGTGSPCNGSGDGTEFVDYYNALKRTVSMDLPHTRVLSEFDVFYSIDHVNRTLNVTLTTENLTLYRTAERLLPQVMESL